MFAYNSSNDYMSWYKFEDENNLNELFYYKLTQKNADRK